MGRTFSESINVQTPDNDPEMVVDLLRPVLEYLMSEISSEKLKKSFRICITPEYKVTDLGFPVSFRSLEPVAKTGL